MRRVLVTQRVEPDPAGGPGRDVLDPAWLRFLAGCDLEPVVVPNDPARAERLASERPFDGLLLTGGNTLVDYGGDAPLRDRVERALLRRALEARVGVIGVCRGMQLLLDHLGTELHEVKGHVAASQEIEIDGAPARVNSYHSWGCHEVAAELVVWARAHDGVVKAVRHRTLPWCGMMWHPERMEPFRERDRALFRTVFAGPAVEPCA